MRLSYELSGDSKSYSCLGQKVIVEYLRNGHIIMIFWDRKFRSFLWMSIGKFFTIHIPTDVGNKNGSLLNLIR